MTHYLRPKKSERPSFCGNCAHGTMVSASVAVCRLRGEPEEKPVQHKCEEYLHFSERNNSKRKPDPLEHVCPRCRKGWRESKEAR